MTYNLEFRNFKSLTQTEKEILRELDIHPVDTINLFPLWLNHPDPKDYYINLVKINEQIIGWAAAELYHCWNARRFCKSRIQGKINITYFSRLLASKHTHTRLP